MTTNSSLLILDAHGIYIPKLFVENYAAKYLINKEELLEDLAELGNPENENYWNAWENVIDEAILKDDEGRICNLWQDGDLWAIPIDEFNEIPEQ
jgi:hypothetical protein